MRKPDYIIDTLNALFQVVPVHEINPTSHAEFFDSLFGKRSGSGKVIDCGFEFGIVQTKMDSIGSRPTAQVEQVAPPGKIYFLCQPGGHAHGYGEHAHKETFPPFFIFFGCTFSDRCAILYSLIQLRPRGHQMVMVHYHVANVLGIVF